MLSGVLRQFQPVAGAAANAADAVGADRCQAAERQTGALLRARAVGPGTWTALASDCSGSTHGLHICTNDAEQLAHLTAYVADGLADGDTCLVIATAVHLRGMRQRLRLNRLEAGPGRLVELDADVVLSGLLRDGWPEPELFDLTLGEVVRALAAAGAPVRAYGEIVGLLHRAGDVEGASQVEKLWAQVLTGTSLTLLCAYQLPVLDDDALQRLRAEHSHTVLAVS